MHFLANNISTATMSWSVWFSALLFSFVGIFISPSAYAAVNAEIQASRLKGVAPLAVFFDATATTSTLTDRPFHEVGYQWGFGDPDAGEWHFGNMENRDKNTAEGPVSAHVFEKPGTYIVTLVATDVSMTRDTASISITVEDPNVVFSGTNTVCFSTTGNFAGCPSGAGQVTTADVRVIDSNIRPGRRLLLRRGETWSDGTLEIFSAGPGTIGAFGSGEQPMLDNVSIEIAPGVSPVVGEPGADDWRIMDLQFANQDRAVASEGEFRNLLLLRLVVRQVGSHAVFFPDSYLRYYNESRGQQHEPSDGVFVVELNSVDAPSYAVGTRYAVLGSSWVGGGTTHNNRYPYLGKAVISNSYYERPGNSTIHLVKMHAPAWEGDALFPPETETREVVLSNNIFHGTIEAWSVSLGPQSPQDYADEHVVDIVLDGNRFTAEGGTVATQLHTAGYNITVRNNVFDLSSSARGSHAATAEARNSSQPPVFGFWFFNNTVYRGDAGAEGVASTASDTVISNNIVYSPVGSSSLGCNDGVAGCTNNLVDTDPRFTDAANADFQLREGSAAIDFGGLVPAFRDIVNRVRPQGAGFDVGAYEFPLITPELQAPANLRIQQ